MTNPDQCSREEKPASLIDLATPVDLVVRIESVVLAQGSMWRAPMVTPGDALKVNVSVNVSELGIDEASGRFVLTLEYQLKGGRDDENDELRIEAQFVVAYSVPSMEGILEENLKAFGETGGIFHTWPFWREFVHSSTARMSLPVLTMPVFRASSRSQAECDSPNRNLES